MKIVASYPPIQSLVLNITKGVHPVITLIKKSNQGHHDVSLTPSQIKKLKKADIVFWTDEKLESFMPKALETTAPDALSVPLMQKTDNLALLPDKTDESKQDMHFWLSPENAKKMLETISQVLIEKDPQNAKDYEKNKEKALRSLDELKEIKTDKNKKIIAFHPGFEYLNDYFGLDIQTAPIDLEKINTPKQIKELNDFMTKEKPDCLIIEPNITKKQLKKLSLKNVPSVRMDAMGWNTNKGKNHYFRMIKKIVNGLKNCEN
jgi:zinc transport system substrate-binding protein